MSKQGHQNSAAEAAATVRQALAEIGQRLGGETAIRAVEDAVLRAAVEEWVDKEPGSTGLLKRVYRVISG